MLHKNKGLKLVLILFFTMQCIHAQLTDLVRLDNSLIPQSNSEDQYTRLKALLNYPIKVGGVGYEYGYSKHLVGYLYTGYTFWEIKDRDEVYKLDDINAFYLRIGIKYKI